MRVHFPNCIVSEKLCSSIFVCGWEYRMMEKVNSLLHWWFRHCGQQDCLFLAIPCRRRFYSLFICRLGRKEKCIRLGRVLRRFPDYKWENEWCFFSNNWIRWSWNDLMISMVLSVEESSEMITSSSKESWSKMLFNCSRINFAPL